MVNTLPGNALRFLFLFLIVRPDKIHVCQIKHSFIVYYVTSIYIRKTSDYTKLRLVNLIHKYYIYIYIYSDRHKCNICGWFESQAFFAAWYPATGYLACAGQRQLSLGKAIVFRLVLFGKLGSQVYKHQLT